jgi:hypothetical protein
VHLIAYGPSDTGNGPPQGKSWFNSGKPFDMQTDAKAEVREKTVLESRR